MVKAGIQVGRKVVMLELSVLAVPGCPNALVMLERLGLVLADYPAPGWPAA